MPADNKYAELNGLLSRLCDDAMDGAQWSRLETLLLDDPAAQDYYRRFMALDVDLAWRACSPATVQFDPAIRKAGDWGFGVGDSGVGIRDFHVPNLHISKSPNQQIPSLSSLHSPLSTNFVGGPVFSYIAATLILGVMLLSAWAYKISHDYGASYATNRQGSTTPGLSTPQRPEPIFVGRVTGMKNCRWYDPQTETYAGAFVPLGRKYVLAAGLLEITYRSGAKVILEGPCRYDVESHCGGYLALGKLTARVESGETRGLAASAASAHPQATNLPSPNGRGAGGEGSGNQNQSTLTLTLSQKERGPDPSLKPQDLSPKTEISKSPNLQISKFTVRTPTAVVTDLGTEFGVEVNPDKETQVHVFRGKVEAEWFGPGGGVDGRAVLTEGQAAVYDAARSAVVPLSARPQDFARSMPGRPERPIDAAAKKTIVKWSGVYRYGDPTKGTSDWETLERFGVWHVNDGITDESEQGKAYWSGRERTPDEYFIIYLAGRFEVERIELMNSHNGPANDRGTKDFEIWAADEVDQENELVAPRLVLKGTLPCRFGAGPKIPVDVFSAAAGDFGRFEARYVKFVAKTFYEGENFGGCGLNEIRVFAVPAGERNTTIQGPH